MIIDYLAHGDSRFCMLNNPNTFTS